MPQRAQRAVVPRRRLVLRAKGAHEAGQAEPLFRDAVGGGQGVLVDLRKSKTAGTRQGGFCSFRKFKGGSRGDKGISEPGGWGARRTSSLKRRSEQRAAGSRQPRPSSAAALQRSCGRGRAGRAHPLCATREGAVGCRRSDQCCCHCRRRRRHGGGEAPEVDGAANLHNANFFWLYKDKQTAHALSSLHKSLRPRNAHTPRGQISPREHALLHGRRKRSALTGWHFRPRVPPHAPLAARCAARR